MSTARNKKKFLTRLIERLDTMLERKAKKKPCCEGATTRKDRPCCTE